MLSRVLKSKCTTCNSLVRTLRAQRSLSASDLRARESCFARIAHFSSLAAYIAKSFRAIWISEKNCRDRSTNLDTRGRYRSLILCPPVFFFSSPSPLRTNTPIIIRIPYRQVGSSYVSRGGLALQHHNHSSCPFTCNAPHNLFQSERYTRIDMYRYTACPDHCALFFFNCENGLRKASLLSMLRHSFGI